MSTSNQAGEVAATDWLYCPICSGKTRIKVREDTVILNLSLYCPKCKRETLICVKDKKVSIIQSSRESKLCVNCV